MKILHNPMCSKSRETLQLIRDNGVEPEIVEYLHDNPGKAELKDILKKLGLKAEDIIRKSEALYKEKYKDKKLTNEE